ncbi:MAG: hypothetical protein H0U16_03725 [Actinobacteria bacterium]|nr:hypothetical protein [Actinomycetota bacterium]
MNIVTIVDRVVPAPVESWPEPPELLALAASGRLVLLPDRLGDLAGHLTASFRDEAQALRVAAMAEGREVIMAVPPGARTAVYREHSADWVLPVVFSVPATIVATLLANQIQTWISRFRDDAGDEISPAPTVRYREATIVAGEVRLREIEGPAPDVADLLRSGAADPMKAPQTAGIDAPEDGHAGDRD